MFISYPAAINIQKVIDAVQSRCSIIKIKPMKKVFLNKIFIKIKQNEKNKN